MVRELFSEPSIYPHVLINHNYFSNINGIIILACLFPEPSVQGSGMSINSLIPPFYDVCATHWHVLDDTIS